MVQPQRVGPAGSVGRHLQSPTVGEFGVTFGHLGGPGRWWSGS